MREEMSEIDSEKVKEAEVSSHGEEASGAKTVSFREDFMVLTKIRLNTFVLITTLFGFILASISVGATWDGGWFMKLFHTILGTGLTAFGSAAFNQLMEIEQDKQMERTANRPLPSQRMNVMTAFTIGWLLSAIGVIHLSATVGAWSAYLAAITSGIYVFIYTPMKRKSSANTLVGAVPGAIPPMIGWVAAGGEWHDGEAWYLFALLFLWQLPHFVAINWLCREEYESAGYKMWSNGDVSGEKTARLAFIFSACLAVLAPIASIGLVGYASWFWGVGGFLAGGYMCWLSVKFRKAGTRESSRGLFLFTLLYLPLALGLLAFSWF